MSQRPGIAVSVIIVNYKVPESLRQALRSLREVEGYATIEVLVVDNASNDRSRETVTSEFPEIQWIQLKQNIGFGKACNVAAKHARGDYLLILNPDTIIAHSTISKALAFIRSHPDVGVLGPKLLNPDGTLQRGCRRGFPTPQAAIYHFSGLSKLFPKSRRFGHYHQTYLDPELSCQVDAISGCFMFIPRHLFAAIGGFDEQFFMYGEDLDLCWRIKESGFKVWYHPEIQIIHLKGTSSAKRVLQSRIAFYEAMILFSKKYRHIHSAFFPRWLIFLGIVVQAAANIGAKLLHAAAAGIIDLTIINATLWLCLIARNIDRTPAMYDPQNFLPVFGVHALLSLSFLFMFAYNGVYSRLKYSVKNLLFSGFFASVIFMAGVYFIKSMAFSRIAFGGATILIMVLLIGWREVLPNMLHQLKRIIFARDNVIVVGGGTIPLMVIQNIEKQKAASIAGILWPAGEERPGQFEGYPVLGGIEDVAMVLQRLKVDTLLIATPLPWYSYIIEALAKIKAKNLTIRWVPKELFDKKPEELPDIIPLKDFSV